MSRRIQGIFDRREAPRIGEPRDNAGAVAAHEVLPQFHNTGNSVKRGIVAVHVAVWVSIAIFVIAGCDRSGGDTRGQEPSPGPASSTALHESVASAASLSPAPAGGLTKATFHSQPTYSSANAFDIGVSPDKRAFTVRFSDLFVEVDAGKSPAPVATRVFSIVLPVDGGGAGLRISFTASGYAFASDGSSGYAVLSVNGKTSVMNFPSGTDMEFVQQLEFEAGRTSECRISVFIVVERGSESAAYLNVSTIDAEMLPRAT